MRITILANALQNHAKIRIHLDNSNFSLQISYTCIMQGLVRFHYGTMLP